MIHLGLYCKVYTSFIIQCTGTNYSKGSTHAMCIIIFTTTKPVLTQNGFKLENEGRKEWIDGCKILDFINTILPPYNLLLVLG